MEETDGKRMLIECSDCSYRRVVGMTDDELPAEAIVRHGRETGHQLTVTRIEPESEPS